MNLPPFLVAIVIIAVLINVLYAIKRKPTGIEKYLEEERLAEDAPINPVPQEFYFVPDISSLPLDNVYKNVSERAKEKIRRLQETIKKRSSAKMLRFPKHYTNNELKLSYGAASLNRISGQEERFADYAFSVEALGNLLLEEGYAEDAKLLFKHCVSMPCGQTGPYCKLAELLAKEGDREGLLTLRENAEVAELSADRKTIEFIDSFINNSSD